MFANMRLNFHGDHMPLVAAMLPPTQAAIAAGTSGEAAPPNPQTDHETVTEPVHQTTSPHDHGSTSPRPTPTTPTAKLNEPVSKPPRPIPTSPSAQVNQQGPSSDPHVESSSKDNDSNPDPNVADDPLGGSFFASPSRSTAALPDCTTSGGYDGEAGKESKVFGVKTQSKGKECDFNCYCSDTSSVPADATQATEFPPISSIHIDSYVHGNDIPTGTASDFSVDPSNKGKSPMVEENPPMKARSFRQIEEDRLGAEAARKLYEEVQAELARVQEEIKKKRQEDVINSTKYYTNADCSDIMAHVHANHGLTADLLGPDVNEENFTKRMVAIIAERRRQFEAQRLQEKRNKPMTFAQQKDFMQTFVKNQSSTIYSTRWTLKYVKTFTNDQLKAEFDKIRNAVADLQAQNLRRSLKRPGVDSPFVDSPPSTPVAAPDTSVNPSISRSSRPRTRSYSSAAGIKTYSTRRKSLATRKMSSSEVDLTAPDNSFIQVLSNDASDASDDDSDPLFFWHVFAAWEVVPTGLGDVNALYFTDKSSKYFTHLREILHLLDRQDLSKLYGMVVKHYEVNPLADTPYPLSASLMKKMLKHKLEVEIDGVGNDMTYVVQLIKFIKNQLASSVPSA
ncbi:hypothetical protein Tco_0156168 [Tanacetum coccineum]